MIIHANILEWAKTYDGPKFHAVLCDPPYHLTEIVKRFGSPDAAPAQYGTDGAFARASKGFMGKDWDGGRVAFEPDTWAAIARHLHPGAFLMAFAGTRGYHRMACAIEDAGFVIQPAIGWAFGSGFPKATRLDVSIDRRAKVERVEVGRKKHAPKFAAKELGYREKDNGFNSREREDFALTEPTTDLARTWQGHRYGGQAMKPSFEFICVARLPYDGDPVESMTRTGAGALNIQKARIPGEVPSVPQPAFNSPTGMTYGFKSGVGRNGEMSGASGRWPANLVLGHSPDCGETCADDCAVVALGRQSGESESSPQERHRRASDKSEYWSNGGGGYKAQSVTHGHSDSGTAARFFYNTDWMYERLEQSDPVGYFAKASSSEREAGLDPRQIQDLRDLYGDDLPDFDDTGRRNTHATIKPISLNRWLATLLLPPDLYAPRRLLVPFAGVASEMAGAILAGWEEVVGVELTAEHIPIARARLRYWEQQKHRFDQGQPIKVKAGKAVAGEQEALF